MHVNRTINVKTSFRTLLCSAFLGALLFTYVHPCSAQISFGKMRDASGKTGAPTNVGADEGDEAFKVNPNEKKDLKANDKKDAKKNVNEGTATTEGKRGGSVNRRGSSGRNGENVKTKPRASTEKVHAQDDVNEVQVDEDETSSKAKSGRPDAKNEANDASANPNKRGPILGSPVSHKYRAGMIFGAQQNGTCSNVIGTAPVPMEFPEQKVRTLEEEFPRVAKVDYRYLREGGARQLVFKMRELKAGQTVQATALFEVTRYPMLPPTDPGIYVIPKKVPSEYIRYTKASNYIESNAKTVRSLAKEVVENEESAWAKVAAILSYVRENIQYKEVMIEKPMRGAMAALKTRDGDCEDLSALFIAMCRAVDVPARLVRVPGHCWAEFYLVDDQKEGYWFPAQVAGTEKLGSLQDTRVILQKGDSFKLPESPKEETLYVKELFMGNVKENAPDPIHQFIQETDPKD